MDKSHIKASDLLIEHLQSSDSPKVSLRAIVEAFEKRGFGFIVLIFALPNCLPGPPGIGSIIGIPMAFVALQLMIGAKRPWLPALLLNREIDRAGLVRMMNGSKKRIRWFEALFSPRLEGLFDLVPAWLLGLSLVILAGCVMIPLPLTNFIPAVSSAIIGLAMIERDGLALLIGSALGLIGTAITVSVVAGIWVVIVKAIEGLFA